MAEPKMAEHFPVGEDRLYQALHSALCATDQDHNDLLPAHFVIPSERFMLDQFVEHLRLGGVVVRHPADDAKEQPRG